MRTALYLLHVISLFYRPRTQERANRNTCWTGSRVQGPGWSRRQHLGCHRHRRRTRAALLVAFAGRITKHRRAWFHRGALLRWRQRRERRGSRAAAALRAAVVVLCSPLSGGGALAAADRDGDLDLPRAKRRRGSGKRLACTPSRYARYLLAFTASSTPSRGVYPLEH